MFVVCPSSKTLLRVGSCYSTHFPDWETEGQRCKELVLRPKPSTSLISDSSSNRCVLNLPSVYDGDVSFFLPVPAPSENTGARQSLSSTWMEVSTSCLLLRAGGFFPRGSWLLPNSLSPRSLVLRFRQEIWASLGAESRAQGKRSLADRAGFVETLPFLPSELTSVPRVSAHIPLASLHLTSHSREPWAQRVSGVFLSFSSVSSASWGRTRP